MALICCNSRPFSTIIDLRKMRNKSLIVTAIVLFITLILLFSEARTCNSTTYANISTVAKCEEDVFVSDTDACIPGAGVNSNSSIECAEDTICFLTLTNCTACTGGRYGQNCTEEALCASECSYDRNMGCDSNGVSKECDLLALKISGPSELTGTKGTTEEILIKITVNLAENDVNVTVNGPEELRPINVSNGLYTYIFNLDSHQPGDYTFTAVALLNQNATDITESTVVTVIVYEPVTIMSVRVKYNTGQEKTIGESAVLELNSNQKVTEFVCSAEGFGADSDKVTWMENGAGISDVSTGNNMYQSVSTNGMITTTTLTLPSGKNSGVYTCEAFNSDNEHNFYNALTIQLRQNITPERPYADESDFIAAVCVLGVTLLFTIIALVLVFIYNSKRYQSASKREKRSSPNITIGPIQDKGRDNATFNPIGSNNSLPMGDHRLRPLNNEYKPNPSAGVKTERTVTTTISASIKSYPVDRGQVSTPHGMRHGECENANKPYITGNRSRAQIPTGLREGGPSTLITDQIPPNIYDEVLTSGKRPPLPRPNDRRLGVDDNVYLRPDGAVGIYEDTIHPPFDYTMNSPNSYS